MAGIPFYGDIQLNKNQLLNARYENGPTFPSTPAPGQFFFLTAAITGYNINHFYGFDGSGWVDLSQVLTNVISLKGEITNANTNPAYPSNPSIGDQYIVTGNAGTVGGTAVEVGDELIYSASGWFVLQRNLTAATTAISGFIRLATQGEAIAGSDASTAISPATLAAFLINFLYVKKARVPITSLVANTLTTITHGLNVANAEDLTVSVWQGGQEIFLAVTTLSVNAIQIQSNIALSNVTVIVQG